VIAGTSRVIAAGVAKGEAMDQSVEQNVESVLHAQDAPLDIEALYTRIGKRLMPFLILLFVMAWLDRVNVGFAKLQMVEDLGFSEAIYGFGAGIFFFGYLLFEIPSNLLLHKIGARKTIARITILWGVTSIATMFVKSATSFYTVRFLLGAFEAGLYPGILLYLTYWFPARRRAQMIGVFTAAIPIAGILGGIFGGWIMGSTGGRAKLANWQWLFLLEGIPPIIMGLLTLAVFDDKPSQARWLTEREKHVVVTDLEEDSRQAGPRKEAFLDALKTPRVWLLAIIYFCLVSANPTLGFWGPTIIKGLGVRNEILIGLLSAVPYIVAVAGMVMIGRHSDRTLERRYHTAVCCLGAAMGVVLIGLFARIPALAFAALVLGVAGVLCAFGPFWQLPTMLLAGSAAAGGIALINSIGNLSGWVGPFVVGWLKDVTGKTSAGLYVVAGFEVLGTVLILLFTPPRSLAEK
jgi:D-galactonate transporter